MDLYLWIHGPILGLIDCKDISISVVDSWVVHLMSTAIQPILLDKYLQSILWHIFFFVDMNFLALYLVILSCSVYFISDYGARLSC